MTEQEQQTYKQTIFEAKPNSLTPYQGKNPPIGTWRQDPSFGEFEVLVEMSLDQITPGEPEEGIKNWKGYPLYVKWAKEGKEAPAIRVVRHIDGHLASCNRRRVLAAKDAGLETITAWFSETNDRGSNAWITRTEGEYWYTRVDGLKRMIADGYDPYPDDIELLTEFGEWNND